MPNEQQNITQNTQNNNKTTQNTRTLVLLQNTDSLYTTSSG